MSKTLGLDLGTNSIGWAVIENSRGEETILEDKGVIIFSEGVKSEKGIESSKAAERTEKRSARRIKFRRKLRKYETLKALIDMEMCPLMKEELEQYRKSGFKKYPSNPEFINWLLTDDNINKNPYYFRHRASKGSIAKLDLGRAFYHMAQRRGFLSNRLDKSDDGIVEVHLPDILNIIDVAELVIELKENLELYFNDLEVLNKKSKDLDAGGKELLKLYNSFVKILSDEGIGLDSVKRCIIEKLENKDNLGAVKKGIEDLSHEMKVLKCETLGQYFWMLYQKDRGIPTNKIRNKYTSREKHYLDEFNVICNKQELSSLNKERLKKAIFYQRDLKSQKGLVGKCSLEKDKTRCPVSHPHFEEFRMLQFINSIKFKNADAKMVFLSKEQKEAIKVLFFRKSKPHFNFSEIAKKLDIEQSDLNYSGHTTVSACPTIAVLRFIWGDAWKQVVIKTNELNKKGNLVNYDYKDIWHVLFTFNSTEKLYEFATDKLNLIPKLARSFSNVHLKKDYASLSLKAIDKILPYLLEGLLYSHAVFMANMNKVVKQEVWKKPDIQALIKNEIRDIIANHTLENKKIFIVNSLLKNSFDNDYTYSLQSKDYFKNDLISLFEKEYGKKAWQKKNNMDEIISQALEEFLNALKKSKFLKAKRIDEKVIEFLDSHYFLADESKMYHPSDLEKFTTDFVDSIELMGSPVTGAIKNPMAMKSMHILRRLLNTLIKEGKIDKNTKVNIELARELNDANKRKAIKSWQNDNEAQKIEIAKKIQDLYSEACNKPIIPSDDDILRYQLWEEQGKVCLYTEGSQNEIGICEVVGGSAETEIEHTIPRSLSYDSTKMNLTLAKKRANQLKGNKIPFELADGGNGLASHKEIKQRISHWKKQYENIESQITQNIRATKNASTKEIKDRKIQQRHKLKLEYNYIKGKYDRFVMEEVPSGFARRQLNDIGTITRYAQEYLRSYFNKVYSVKGVMVDEFRKAWGLHDTETVNGYVQYKKKSRDSHSHHCKDAITIACMDKKKYDLMAEAWRLEEEGDKEKAKFIISENKPWANFSKDVRNIDESLIIVHHSKDVVPIQTKRKLRKRGKIQYNSDGQVKYEKGDGLRGSLHKDTFYGAIAKKDAAGQIVYDKDKNIIPVYTERVGIEKISKNQVTQIVDPIIKEKIEQAISGGLLKIKDSNSDNKIAEEGIWMNKEKHVPIKKVKVFSGAVKSPLHIKEHRDLSIHKYKQSYHAINDGNYCMAIYEKNEKEKIERFCKIVNLMEAASFYKSSNLKNVINEKIVPSKNEYNADLKYVLTKGQMVLLYDKEPSEIWELSRTELGNRLHEITQLDIEKSANIKLLIHEEAREKKEITKAMGLKTGMKGGKNIGKTNEYPWIKIGPTKFDALVEGYDFEISITGEIKRK